MAPTELLDPADLGLRAESLQAAYERGTWRGAVDQRLAGHDRDFAEVRVNLAGIQAEQQLSAARVADLHADVLTGTAVSRAIKETVERSDSRRLTIKQLMIGASMLATALVGAITTVLALTLH